MQKCDKTSYNGKNVSVNIPGLDNKDVMVYFRFWDDFTDSEYPIFQFENYRTINNKLLQEENSLYIWDKNANVPLKDYIQEKLSPPASYPFYSDREYAFIVKDFERNGIQYLDKRFKLKFGVDDRTVITHIPLTRRPAVVKVISNVNNIQMKINGKSSGHIFSKYKDTQKYLVMPYSSVKPTVKGEKQTFIFKTSVYSDRTSEYSRKILRISLFSSAFNTLISEFNFNTDDGITKAVCPELEESKTTPSTIFL